MTAVPAASLHVETPKLADMKPSSTYPPTPVTSHSQNSATSSRLDLPVPPLPDGATPASHLAANQEHRSGSDDLAKAPDSDHHTPSSARDMPQEDVRSSADQGAREEQQASHAHGLEGLANRIGMPGIVCAPPDILPPSPPLTVADARDEPEAGSSTLTGAAGPSSTSPPSHAAPPAMREEDITNWRASMHKGDEREEERREEREEQAEEDDEVREMNGEYDPYDLGYSPETPVGPSSLNARTPTTPTAPTSLQKKEALDHPLRLDVNPPTPPPWEVIQPPESIENVLAEGRVYPSRANNGPKPLSSRPLIPHSAYYFGPPPVDSAYGTDPVGHIGVHHPREIIRIERDYATGELPQFATTYPLELEGRITPTQFLDTINTINEILISAHSLRHSFVDNALSFFTLQISRLVLTPHYEKEMRKLQQVIEELNGKVYNPVGLNILWPRRKAFMFLEMEYY